MGLFKKLFSSALTAAVSIGITVATGGTATWALFGRQLATSFILGYVAEALAPKAKATELRDNTVSSRNPVAPRRLVYGRSRVGGSIVYLESTGSDNKYLHMIVTLATHEIDAVEKVYLNDDLVWVTGTIQSGWSGYVDINEHLGADDQTADSDLVSAVGQWTTDHRLRGVAYLYVKLTYDQDKFASGLPNVSAVIRGKKVYTGSVTEWSQNPVWCIRDYLIDEKYGMDVDTAELDATSFTTAANVCDETVTTSEGNQTRYTMDGVIDLSESRSSIIESMLTSCGGVITYSGGKFIITASKYYAPTITIDESVIVGNISIDTKRSRRDLYNGVKGVFLSAADNYIAADYPPVISSTYSTEDGDPLYLDLNLPFTTDATRAQRLAKLVLLQGREQISASIPCNLSALKLKAGDFIYVTNERMGWSQKVFRITGYEIAVNAGDTIGVNLQVVETSSAVYDWTTSDETPFVAGESTTLANPLNVIAPTSLTVTASATIQEDGTARPNLDVSWSNQDAFTREYELQYRKDAGTYQSIITRETTYRLEDIEVDASYDVRVRAINNLGVKSAFVTTSATGTGDGTAPNAPSGLTATGGFSSISLSWTNPTDADLDVIQIFEGTSSVRANASLFAVTKGSSFTRSGLADGVTRWYWIRAVDYSGNISEYNAATGVSASTSIPFTQDDVIGNIEVVSSLTSGLGSGDEGKTEYLTTNNKLYLWNGTSWITGVAAGDITGTITTTQITDDAITTPKIATNAVTSDSIAANTIVGANIAANTISSDKLSVTQLSAITANAGTLTAGNIYADAVRFDDLSITKSASGNYLVVKDSGITTGKIADRAATDFEFYSSSGTGTFTRTDYFTMSSAGEIVCLVDVLVTGTASSSSSVTIAMTLSAVGGSASYTVSSSGLIAVGSRSHQVFRSSNAGSCSISVTVTPNNIGSAGADVRITTLKRYK